MMKWDSFRRFWNETERFLGPVHTYPDIFENASFLSVFGHRKRSFSKTLSRVDLFENAVFMLSCGWVKTEKTELFENVDVTASI